MPNPVRIPVAHAHGVPAKAAANTLPDKRMQMSAPVRGAGFRKRHKWLVASFFLIVFLPLGVAGWYLYTRAADQFISSVGFVIRTESPASAQDLISGIPGFSALSSTSSSDTDVLYEYLLSQALVARVDKRLNLRAIWSKPENDPVFAFDPNGSIEDLTKYWQRMLRVSYDPGTRLISLQAHAFAPEDAQSITSVVLQESSVMINKLSAIARKDTIRHAQEEYALASKRLAQARKALKNFRAKTHIVDPMADLQGEMGVLGQLQQKLAEELIALDMLRSNASSIERSTSGRRNRSGDLRIPQAELRVQVLRDRIAAERENFGGNEQGRDYAALVGEFDRLTVDLKFAEKSYVAAMAVLEAARADANRQSRYLATYSPPTLAEKPLYPKRIEILAVLTVLLVLGWATMVLMQYNLQDRR